MQDEIQDEIQPALTPEEWAKMGAGGVIYIDHAKTMAACNAALPDDDPRRITRTDLAGVSDALVLISDQEAPHTEKRLEALYDKLVALLPPI